MSDSFKSAKNASDEDILNADDIVAGKPDRIDIRYDRKVITVTDAEKAGNYTVKKWPTLSDGEDELPVNALGLNIKLVNNRRRDVFLQKRQAVLLYENECINEAHDLIDEWFQEEAGLVGYSGISLEEVEKIRQDAYEEGKQQGLEEGRNTGIQQGLEEGKQQGFSQGLEQGTQKGYEEGFTRGQVEGFEKGHSEGLDSGQNVVVDQAERFRYLADCLANPLREADKEVTDEIAYIISRLVKVIIHREIRENPEFLKKSIESALSILPVSKEGYTISLNPDDYAVITTAIGPDYISAQKWQLKEDPSLEQGDLKVESAESEVSWRINDRIDSLLDDFLSGTYTAVNSALHESIEGCPEYNEVPKKPVAPRNLDDISETLSQKVKAPSPAASAPDKADVTAEKMHSEAVTATPPEEVQIPDPMADVVPPPPGAADNPDADLTDDPAPYMDDLGHPVHLAPDGSLYYFDEKKQRVYVDQDGNPIPDPHTGSGLNGS